MMKGSIPLVSLLVLSGLTMTHQQQHEHSNVSLSLVAVPSSGKVPYGSEYTVACSTLADITTSSVLWYRVQGSLIYQIGVDDMLHKDFLTDGDTQRRYRLTGGQSALDETSLRMYTLTVTDAVAEDSADIECTLMPGGVTRRTSIAVCDNVDSSACDCMLNNHWASPLCFTGVESNIHGVATGTTELRRATIGLAVTVALLLLYSCVMCGLLRRESSEELELKRRERDEYTACRAATKQGQSVIGEIEFSDVTATTNGKADISSKNPPDSIIKRNVGNTRMSGRRAERAQTALNKEETSRESVNEAGIKRGSVNEGFVSDTEKLYPTSHHQQQKQLPLSAANLAQVDYNIPAGADVKLSNSNRLQHGGPASKVPGRGGRGIGSYRGENDLSGRDFGSIELSSSENRTASYTSNANSVVSNNPHTYEPSARPPAMSDTMI